MAFVLSRKRDKWNGQIIDWAKSFLNTHNQEILIMDNLSSHLNDDVTKFLASYNITVLYLPVRCASILSPLDNSFFSILKRRLASPTAVKPYQDAVDKQKCFNQVFNQMIREGLALHYLKLPNAFIHPHPRLSAINNAN